MAGRTQKNHGHTLTVVMRPSSAEPRRAWPPQAGRRCTFGSCRPTDENNLAHGISRQEAADTVGTPLLRMQAAPSDLFLFATLPSRLPVATANRVAQATQT